MLNAIFKLKMDAVRYKMYKLSNSKKVVKEK